MTANQTAPTITAQAPDTERPGALAVQQPPAFEVFTGGVAAFEAAQRMAAALCSSSIVPDAYRGQHNLGNCLVALDLANRLGASPLAIMQNVVPIKGKPTFASSFLIGMVNSCGRFTPLEFILDDPAKPTSCHAVAVSRATGRELIGETITVAMAKAEGWWSRPDRSGNETSKWPTMTGQMLRYRAAAFWQRIFAPELTQGFRTTDEVIDIEAVDVVVEPAPAAAAPAPAPVARRRGSNPPAPASKPPAPPAPPAPTEAPVAAVAAPAPAPAPVAPPEPVPAPVVEPAPAPVSEIDTAAEGLARAFNGAVADPDAVEEIAETGEVSMLESGLAMVTTQSTIAQLVPLLGQARQFAADGLITIEDLEKIATAVEERKVFLTKPITKFERGAALKFLADSPELLGKIEQLFGIQAGHPAEEWVLQRQHIEAIRELKK